MSSLNDLNLNAVLFHLSTESLSFEAARIGFTFETCGQKSLQWGERLLNFESLALHPIPYTYNLECFKSQSLVSQRNKQNKTIEQN